MLRGRSNLAIARLLGLVAATAVEPVAAVAVDPTLGQGARDALLRDLIERERPRGPEEARDRVLVLGEGPDPEDLPTPLPEPPWSPLTRILNRLEGKPERTIRPPGPPTPKELAAAEKRRRRGERLRKQLAPVVKD